MAGLALADSSLQVLGIDVGKLWKGFPVFDCEPGRMSCASDWEQPYAFTPECVPLIEGTYVGQAYAVPSEPGITALKRFLKGLQGFEKGQKAPYKIGHFFIAIDIEAFTPLKSFKKIAGDICRELRASKKVPGATRIYTAGEKEHLAWLERKDKGAPINEVLRKQLDTMRAEDQARPVPVPVGLRERVRFLPPLRVRPGKGPSPDMP